MGLADRTVTPAFRKPREKARESQSNLGYIVSPTSKKKKKKGLRIWLRVLVYNPGFDP